VVGLVVVLAAARATARPTAERWDPKTTWVVIAGVLEWQDKGIATFAKADRRDQAFYDLLAARGVPASQRVLLLDAEATTQKIEAALVDMAKRAPADATLIFYYAGHGMKSDAGQVVLASYDVRPQQAEKTGLAVHRVPALLQVFRGRRVLLLADCCFSGALAEAAKVLGARGIEAAALTSAEASNVSTGNWTYTMTLLDGFGGRALTDRDHDGAVTIGELAVEVRDELRAHEQQRAGVARFGLAETWVVAEAKPDPEPLAAGRPPLTRGVFVVAPMGDQKGEGGKAVGRVLGARGDALLVAFWGYTRETQTWVARAACEPFVLKAHPVGTKLQVLWSGVVYDAVVTAVSDGFMRITYPGWDASWDEWVGPARVAGEGAMGGKNTGRKPIKVEWKGEWYDAILKEQQGASYCIHYLGHDASWDECVPKARIRL
jgi:hypothetical protein